MNDDLKRQILALLNGHRTLTLATLRPDGWPQATTVGYANDGFSIYFLCAKESQKAANLTRDNRVSLTINDDEPQVMKIQGLSMAARARRVTDAAEGEKIIRLLFARYPDQEGVTFPAPKPADVALFCLTPTVVSVLDYTKGFAHTDLVSFEPEMAAA